MTAKSTKSSTAVAAKKTTKTRSTGRKSAGKNSCPITALMQRHDCYIKAFLAGVAFPAVLLPIFYTILYFVKKEVIYSHDFQFIPLYVPILFGLFNMIYCAAHKYCKIKNHNYCLWSVGGLLGLLAAFPTVFILDVPSVLFGFNGMFIYTPFVILPVIYGVIFRYIISCLNNFLGVKSDNCK